MTNQDINDVWIGGDDFNSNRLGSKISPIIYSSSDTGSAWTRLIMTDAESVYTPVTPNGNVFTRASMAITPNRRQNWGLPLTFFILDRQQSQRHDPLHPGHHL